jgi:hypothetical protein
LFVWLLLQLVLIPNSTHAHVKQMQSKNVDHLQQMDQLFVEVNTMQVVIQLVIQLDLFQIHVIAKLIQSNNAVVDQHSLQHHVDHTFCQLVKRIVHILLHQHQHQ